MGSLLDERMSKINSTLQILSEHGVTVEDLRFFREYREAFAATVAKAFRDGPWMFRQAAYGSLQSALSAVGDIVDWKMLKEIYDRSLQHEVLVLILHKMSQQNQDELYHVLRTSSERASQRAAWIEGAAFLNNDKLRRLGWGDGWNPRQQQIRQRVAEALRSKGMLVPREWGTS